MADDAKAALEKATAGLLYPSDSEAPFEAFAWPKSDGDAKSAVLANGKVPAGAKIEEVTADAFFGELSGDSRFSALRQTLEQTVQGLRIFRVGEVKVVILLIGKLADGRWAGLRTTSVES